MKNNKLVSMVDFVLNQSENTPLVEFNEVNDIFVNSVLQYANFLNTPLNLGMFVPAIEVNGKWEVMEEPNMSNYAVPDKIVLECSHNRYLIDAGQYQTQKDKVIFEGCISAELDGSLFYLKFNNNFTLVFQNSDTIEWLVEEEINLTEYGIKISGI